MSLRGLAEERGLEFDPEGRLSEATPLLIGLESGRSLGTAEGDLAPGLTGRIGITQFDEGQPGGGVVTALETRIPESVGLLPILTCREVAQRDLRDRTVGAGGVFKLQKQVELESVKLGKRFLIGVSEGQDENWVRQVFSPTFVDHLAERSPEGCNFELYNGVLAFETREASSGDALKELTEFAALVAQRLRTEALEQEGMGGRSWRGSDDARLRRWEADNQRVLDSVQFDALPATIGAAGRRFSWRVRRMPLVWLSSLGFGVLMALIFVGIPTAILVPLGAFVADGDPPWGTVAPIVGALFATVAVLVTVKIARGQVTMRTTMLGFESFVAMYARERGLELVDPQRFHSENVRLESPGVAQKVLRGRLPGTELEGALVIAKDQATVNDARFDYSLGVFDGERMTATSAETSVLGWSAATLDDFCASNVLASAR